MSVFNEKGPTVIDRWLQFSARNKFDAETQLNIPNPEDRVQSGIDAKASMIANLNSAAEAWLDFQKASAASPHAETMIEPFAEMAVSAGKDLLDALMYGISYASQVIYEWKAEV